MSNNKLINFLIVGSSTLGARITGLFRDMIMFAFLGAGSINSAFIFAYQIPNLFRRLTGEGALTSALIPIFSENYHKNGKENAFAFLNKLLSWTTLGMLFLSGIIIVCFLAIDRIGGLEERYYLGAKLGIILIPYMLMVCLSATFSAVLNVLDRFGIAASCQIWLNITMMVSLGVVATLFCDNANNYVYYLCGGVLAGGLLQLFLPAYALWQTGWRPKIDFTPSESLKTWLKLFLPGVGGAAIYQVNLFVTSLLAFYLSASAVSMLYLANRLILLPQGLFAVSLVTVLFPSFARLILDDEKKHELKALYMRGVRILLIITIPATIGLIVLREDILYILFVHGKFSLTDVKETGSILAFASLSIPLQALASLSVRGFHALKDTNTPYKISLLSFSLNIVLSFILMQFIGVMGLIAANVLTCGLQAILLQIKLSKAEPTFFLDSFKKFSLQILSAVIAMLLIIYGANWLWDSLIVGQQNKLHAIINLAIIIPLAITAYVFALWLLNVEEKEDIRYYLAQIIRKIRS